MFLWKPKTCLKGTVARDFFLRFFFFMNRLDSTSKTMPNNAELKLLSCGLEVADSRKNCDCGIAELRLRSNMSLKSCGIAIAEELPSSCGIAIADSKKSCACPPLVFTEYMELYTIYTVETVYCTGNKLYTACWVCFPWSRPGSRGKVTVSYNLLSWAEKKTSSTPT